MRNIYINNFIKRNDLQKADVIIARRNGFNVLDHYIVYLGYSYESSQHIFAGNLSGGARLMGENEVWTLIQGYSPTKIRRFNGSDYARNAAENRAYALLGTTYDLITSNCEHFANYVQFGKYKSQQSDNFAAIGVFGGLALILIALTGSR